MALLFTNAYANNANSIFVCRDYNRESVITGFSFFFVTSLAYQNFDEPTQQVTVSLARTNKQKNT